MGCTYSSSCPPRSRVRPAPRTSNEHFFCTNHFFHSRTQTTVSISSFGLPSRRTTIDRSSNVRVCARTTPRTLPHPPVASIPPRAAQSRVSVLRLSVSSQGCGCGPIISSLHHVCQTPRSNQTIMVPDVSKDNEDSPNSRTDSRIVIDNTPAPSRKFGKQIQKRQLEIPEYAASFVDYKALKKVTIQTNLYGLCRS